MGVVDVYCWPEAAVLCMCLELLVATLEVEPEPNPFVVAHAVDALVIDAPSTYVMQVAHALNLLRVPALALRCSTTSIFPRATVGAATKGVYCRITIPSSFVLLGVGFR